MDFSFSDEQQLLQETVRRYTADHYGFEQRKKIIASPGGCARSVWKDFADLGLLGLNVPAGDGGLGGGALETLLVAGVMGEALVVEPFLSSAVIATRAIAVLGAAQQRQSLLGSMSSGELIVVMAHDAAPATEVTVPVRATKVGSGWRLHGRVPAVYHAPVADLLLVAAASEPGGAPCDCLFAIKPQAPGLTLHSYVSVDAQVAADVMLDGVTADVSMCVATSAGTELEAVSDFGAMALCAEALGALDKALALTVEYSRTRQQFGGLIGRFQALQHRMVDMLMRIEQARSLVYLAAARCDGANREERESAVSGAKVLVADAARFVGQQAVQLHGGMGVADESSISHYFKRLLAAEIRFGSADAHLQRFAAMMPV